MTNKGVIAGSTETTSVKTPSWETITSTEGERKRQRESVFGVYACVRVRVCVLICVLMCIRVLLCEEASF